MLDTRAILAYGMVLVILGLASCSAVPVSSSSRGVEANGSDSPGSTIDEEFVCDVDFKKVNMELVSCAIDNSNPKRTYRFFSVCSAAENNEDIDVGVYFEDLETRQVYKIESTCFLNYRPVAENEWISDERIGFVIWSNPHHGYYFEVNVRDQNIEINYPVSDQPGAPPIPIQ